MPSTTPPRAPGAVSCSVGSGAHGGHRAPRPSARAVDVAIPDGASTLRSWWSSMISAVSKYGRRSRRTASSGPPRSRSWVRPRSAPGRRRTRPERVEVAVGDAARADDGMDAVHRQPRHEGARHASATVTSTTTSQPASAKALSSALIVTPDRSRRPTTGRPRRRARARGRPRRRADGSPCGPRRRSHPTRMGGVGTGRCASAVTPANVRACLALRARAPARP
jgi:hypothetical protein